MVGWYYIITTPQKRDNIVLFFLRVWGESTVALLPAAWLWVFRQHRLRRPGIFERHGSIPRSHAPASESPRWSVPPSPRFFVSHGPSLTPLC